MVFDPTLVTLLVVAVAFVFFVLEIVPAVVTSLASAAILMLLGVIDVKDGFSGFSNEATLAVLFMLLIAAAIERSGFINVLAHRVLDIAKAKPGRLLLLLIVSSGFVSAVLNNTTVVAIFIPLVATVATRMRLAPGRFMMPMAFATTLGGMITLIGTSTNLLASSTSARLGYGKFTMFLFAPVGLAVFLAGGLYLYFVAPRLLKDAKAAPAGGYDLLDYVCEVVIEPGSPLVGQSVERSNLKARYNIDTLRLARENQTHDQPLTGMTLKAGDILVIRAPRDELLKVRQEQGIAILPEITHWNPESEGPTKVIEAIVAPRSELEGSTSTDWRFRGLYDAVVLAVRKRERMFLRRVHNLKLEAGDSLLIRTTPTAIEAMKARHDLIIAEELAPEVYRPRQIPIVLSVLGAVVGAAALDLFPLHLAALAGVVILLATGALRPSDLAGSVPWELILMLAGLIPMGIALEKSGAAQLAATKLALIAGHWTPMMMLAAFYLLALAVTEFMSNNATVVLLMPIAAEFARSFGLAVMPFLLVITFAASLAFMVPVGYQTYMMVYGPGGYRFSHFVKVGVALDAIAGVVAVVVIGMLWPPM